MALAAVNPMKRIDIERGLAGDEISGRKTPFVAFLKGTEQGFITDVLSLGVGAKPLVAAALIDLAEMMNLAGGDEAELIGYSPAMGPRLQHNEETAEPH